MLAPVYSYFFFLPE